MTHGLRNTTVPPFSSAEQSERHRDSRRQHVWGL